MDKVTKTKGGKKGSNPSFYPNEITTKAEAVAPAPQPEAEDLASVLLSEIAILSSEGPFTDVSGKIAVRVFKTADKMLMGFLLEETPDSFILACASTLREEPAIRSVVATSVTSAALSRVLKSSVEIVSLPAPLHLFYFLVGVRDRVVEAPSYFTSARIEHIDNLISSLKKLLNIDNMKVTDRDSTETKNETKEVDTRIRFRRSDTPRQIH